MSTNQAAFNAVVIAVQNNVSTLAPYLMGGSLSLTGLGITDQDAIALGVALKNNTSVMMLHLEQNSIGDTGASGIAQALASNTTLTELSLSYNLIGDTGASAIGQWLTSNTALRALSLENNSIGDMGGSAIGEALVRNTALTYLDLYNNLIGPTGASSIGQALASNTALTQLILSFNLIGDAGASAIAQALASNTALTFLGIRFTSITDTGASAIGKALASNTALTYLDLTQNSIGDIGASAIAQALASNTALRVLTLSNNSIGDTGASAIEQALSSYNFSLIGIGLSGNSAINTTTMNSINASTTRNSQYPYFAVNHLHLLQGGSLTLSPTYLEVTTSSGVSIPIAFNLTQITHGQLVNTTTGLPITQFTQLDVNAGLVKVIDDGSSFPLTYALTASNGTLTTLSHQGAVVFTKQLNPPLLSKNSLTLSQNQNTILSTNNLLASFDGVTPLPGLLFNVLATGGQFQYVNTLMPLSAFSQADLIHGDIEFACDNSGNAPVVSVAVSDGTLTSQAAPAVITYVPLPTTTTTTTTKTTSSTTTTTAKPTTTTLMTTPIVTTTSQPPSLTPSTQTSTPESVTVPDINSTIQITTVTTVTASSPTALTPTVPSDSSHPTSGLGSLVGIIAGVVGAGLVGLAGYALWRRWKATTKIDTLPLDEKTLPMESNPLHPTHKPDQSTLSAAQVTQAAIEWNTDDYSIVNERPQATHDSVIRTAEPYETPRRPAPTPLNDDWLETDYDYNPAQKVNGNIDDYSISMVPLNRSVPEVRQQVGPALHKLGHFAPTLRADLSLNQPVDSYDDSFSATC